MPRGTSISPERKFLIVSNFNRGYYGEEIAKMLNVRAPTVRRIIREYKAQGRTFVPPQRRGRKLTFLPDVHGKWVDEKLAEDCTARLSKLQEGLLAKFGIKFSLPTINRGIDKFHYSFKKPPTQRRRLDPDKAWKARTEYARSLLACCEEREDAVFFLDETRLSLSTRLAPGCTSKEGASTKSRTVGLRTRDISLMACIGLSRGTPRKPFVVFELFEDPENRSNVETFLKKVSARLQDVAGSKATLVMCSPELQKCENAQDLFPKTVTIRMCCLPPCSPFFNPVEGVFEAWKSRVISAQAKNGAELTAALSTAMDSLSADTIDGYIRHAVENHRQCSKGNKNLR